MRRSRRRIFENLLFTSAYRCDACRLRVRISRLAVLKKLRYAACPRCGGYSLSVLARRDHIDAMWNTPVRIIVSKMHARLYHCRGCRLQFYDLRRRVPASERKLFPESVTRHAPAR